MDIRDMQEMQKALQARYLDQWGGLSPEKGQNSLLWMLGEAGEVIDILKKKGHAAVMNDPEIRRHFVEEMADVMMYYQDVLLSFEVTPEELETVYREKFHRNMNRWK